ncbi:MAG TPA: mevalonate kinase [Anaerolineae bacterium]|nr:mevalonate kinase [Anaerolineae bacterium]
MAPASIESSAPGKVILFGEHAVVYGQPAIAVPVTEVQASATVEPAPPGSGLTLVAPDLGTGFPLAAAPQDEPLAAAARLTLTHLSAPEPDATLTVRSTIPIASGLGSGTAVSTALIRALAGFLGRPVGTADVSALVFEVEKIHHGTPSGVDNTVVVYEQPVYFVRGRPVERLTVGAPFTLVIGDTGIRSSTRRVVEQVSRAWQRSPAHYDALFDQIGDTANQARRAIEAGRIDLLGRLMDDNHEFLIELGVSSPELDELVETARLCGAMGAKLSGAGQGGNMVALVEDDCVEEVTEEMREAGAVKVICTKVTATLQRIEKTTD